MKPFLVTVDDDPEVSRAVERDLRRKYGAEYRILRAESGSEALASLELLKLRNDYKQQEGKAYSLRTFHDTLLGNGAAPFWLHRQLMLGDDTGDVIE